MNVLAVEGGIFSFCMRLLPTIHFFASSRASFGCFFLTTNIGVFIDRRAAAQAKGGRSGTGSGRPLPNLNNPTEMQAFFLQEVQLGEELMAAGKFNYLFSSLRKLLFLKRFIARIPYVF